MKHIIDNDGNECWTNENSYHHRENGGPAYISNLGSESWYKNDYLHRENGPAVIHTNGKEFWRKFGNLEMRK